MTGTTALLVIGAVVILLMAIAVIHTWIDNPETLVMTAPTPADLEFLRAQLSSTIQGRLASLESERDEVLRVNRKLLAERDKWRELAREAQLFVEDDWANSCSGDALEKKTATWLAKFRELEGEKP